MLKEGTAKVWLGSYLVQKVKSRYSWGLLSIGFSSIEYAKIKHDEVLISLKY